MKYNNKIVWRKLDNSAKLFPSISNRKFSTVFRISGILNEEIKPDVLEISVNEALEKFISFKMKLRKGLFWYYLEANQKVPIIEEENNYPCKYINPNDTNYIIFYAYYRKMASYDNLFWDSSSYFYKYNIFVW